MKQHADMSYMLQARRIAKPEAAFKIARLRPELPRKGSDARSAHCIAAGRVLTLNPWKL